MQSKLSEQEIKEEGDRLRRSKTTFYYFTMRWLVGRFKKLAGKGILCKSRARCCGSQSRDTQCTRTVGEAAQNHCTSCSKPLYKQYQEEQQFTVVCKIMLLLGVSEWTVRLGREAKQARLLCGNTLALLSTG